MIDKHLAEDILGSVAKRLQTQDNRITRTPIYVVLAREKKEGPERFITACLTNQAAEDYIKNHGHTHVGHGELYVYVDSAWRNAEWQLIRECLCVLFGDQDENGNPISPTGGS